MLTVIALVEDPFGVGVEVVAWVRSAKALWILPVGQAASSMQNAHDYHTHESHRAEGLLLNVGDAQQEADAVVHAQEAAERRTRWTLFAEACAAPTYCIGPAGRMRW